MDDVIRVIAFFVFFVSVNFVGLVQIYRYYYVQKYGKEVIFRSFLLRKWQQGKNFKWLKTENIKETSKGYLYSGIFAIISSIVCAIILLNNP